MLEKRILQHMEVSMLFTTSYLNLAYENTFGSQLIPKLAIDSRLKAFKKILFVHCQVTQKIINQ